MPTLPFRPSRSAVAGLAAIATLVAVVSTPGQSAAGPVGRHKPPVAPRGVPVPGHSAAPVVAARQRPMPLAQTVASAPLPAGSYSVSLPVSTAATAASTSSWQPIGSTGLAVSRSLPSAGRAAGATTSSVGKLAVTVLGRPQAAKLGLNGPALSVARTDGQASAGSVAIRVPAALLAGQYGADYASRVHWVMLPAAGVASASKLTPVTTAQATATSTVLTVPVSPRQMVLTPMAGVVSSTGAGTFAATPLKPSSSWQVSTQTGDFAWNYPLAAPPAAAGPSPSLAFSYDSGSIDGETGSTNNQPSQVGEGWELSGAGFIERKYVSCSEDDGPTGAVTSSGDLCWKTDNAVMSFGGHSGNLVKDATTGTWKLQSDDGSRVEHLTSCVNGTWDNDCWRLTTTDGTQYYFGMNQLPGWATGKAVTNSTWTVPVYGNDPGEPGYNGTGGHAGTFATEAKTQAWRWNLDYVVDPHSNAEAMYYTAETNRYAQNGSGGTLYTRGGELKEIDYGLQSSAIYTANAASDKVLLSYVDRCNTGSTCSSAVPANMPDVPWDQNCTASPCTGKVSPTFWSEMMLTTLTTQARTAATVYSTVDAWTLSHHYYSPGDTTSASLSLAQLQQVASVSGSNTVGGSITLSPVVFTAQVMDNRVWDSTSGLAHLAKYRIYKIVSDTGSSLSVVYKPTDPACTYNYGQVTLKNQPDSDNHACFQQWWTPSITPPQPVRQDLFHKYLVSQVDEDPVTGGVDDVRVETQYLYTGAPAWRYDNSPLVANKYRTWSDYAGFSSVEVRKGNISAPNAQQVTDYTFYQGMDGDHLAGGGSRSASITVDGTTVTDSRWLAGQTRDAVSPDPAGGTALSDVLSTPWVSPVTADDGTLQARIVKDGTTRSTVPLSTGGTRSRVLDNSYDPSSGLIVSSSDATPDAGSTCTRTSYAQNHTSWLLAYPSEVSTVGQDCNTTATLPADAVSDVRTYYDGGVLGAAPTKGEPTTVTEAESYTGSTPNWLTVAQTKYDGLGRPTQVTDRLNRINTTAYTPATSGPLTSVSTVTDSGTGGQNLNWPSITTFNPARGTEISYSDQNALLTSASYDALGRRSQVWLPNRPKATYPTSPTTSYGYTVSTTAPLSVATTTLTANGTTVTSYALYDGLGRPRQTQGWAESKNTGGTHILAGSVVTDTLYDSAGRPSLTNPSYYTPSISPSGTLFVPGTTIPGQLRTDYDAAGRKTADVQLVNGSEVWRTSYSYAGADRTNITPPAGGTPTATFVDSRGRTSQLWQYDSATISGTPLATNYGYDVRGAMTSMTDATTHNHWSWTYDVLGRQVSATDPDSGTRSTVYDDGDRVSSTVDAGRVTAAGVPAAPVTLAYKYDDADRKTDEYLGSIGGTTLAHWAYDSLYKGQLTSSTSYAGTDAFTRTVLSYDTLYRPTATTLTIPSDPALTGSLAGSYENDYSYNLANLPATVTDQAAGGLPDEQFITDYSDLGNVVFYGGYTAYLADDSFTGANLLSQENLTAGNGQVDRTFYYATGTNRLTRLLTTTSASSNFTTADHNYSYLPGGQLSEDYGISNAGTDIQCFGYDHLQELTTAWTSTSTSCAAPTTATIGGLAPYWTSYGYDQASGNRTSVTNHTLTGGADAVSSYNYPAAGTAQPNFATSVDHTGASTGTDSYTADPSGDTTGRPGQSLVYSPEGRLATATTAGQTMSNIYDADGTLLLTVDPANGTTLYLGDTELHTPAGSPSGSVTGVRTYSVLGTPIAERSTTVGGPVNGTVMWLNADRNNTVTDEVADLSMTPTHRYLDPFGNARGTVPSWSSGHTLLNAPNNPATSTVHLGARDYDPSLGRFLTVDPMLAPSAPQSINGYSYTSNDPVNHSDPTGLMQEVENGGTDCIHTGRTCTDEAINDSYSKGMAEGLDVGNYDDFVNRANSGTATGSFADFVGGALHAVAPISDLAHGCIGGFGLCTGTWTSQAYNKLFDVNTRSLAYDAGNVGANVAMALVPAGLADDAAITAGRLLADGAAGRTVVMGRAMGRVVPYAEKNGYDYYKGTPSWIPRKLEEAAPRTMERVDMWFNKRWINNEMKAGSRIINIGEPDGMRPSPFYNMEMQRVDGYWNYFEDLQP